MSDVIRDAYDSQSVQDIVRRLDNYSFQKAISEESDVAPVDRDEIDRLWVAATLSVDDNLGGADSEFSLLDSREWAGKSFDKWLTFVDSSAQFSVLEQRDVLQLISAGLLASRQTELRQVLKKNSVIQCVSDDLADSESWLSLVRDYIFQAIYLLARQDGRKDVAEAVSLLSSLRKLQSDKEKAWLAGRGNKEQSALSLLALYHTSSAADTLARYLVGGVVTTPTGKSGNISNELAVLTSKAAEYAELSSDPELVSWVRCAASSILQLRSDAIWSNAKNINGLIDQFIAHLADRGSPVFSLLPSQQEALRKNFLDARSEAVILQMPTSSGKTLMAELAALHTVSSYSDARVVYLTPTRALSTQVKRTLSADFREMGIDVVSAGSAYEEDPYELTLLEGASGVVVATPEKMDLLLRSHSDWFDSVRLLIVDEAHLLKDGERGARLELLLANFRREHPHIRMLLLTPFVDNAEELARWLSGERGAPVDVKWRPSRLMIGIAAFKGRVPNKFVEIEWKEPHRLGGALTATKMTLTPEENDKFRKSSSSLNKSIIIGGRLQKIGPVLGMYPSSRSAAETAAFEFASEAREVDLESASPEHRVAVALAESEYGEDSKLAYCLRRGVAYHHSALSNELRYLVERLAASKKINFLAATTTLAQGMNFPVSSVIIHSAHVPQRSNLTPAEFWNIAGRAGRVGLSERGLIVFANKEHRDLWNFYTENLSERIDSALDDIAEKINDSDSLKWIYRTHEPVRPFLQYLSHASATLGIRRAYADLERLVEASFSGRTKASKDFLFYLAKKYLGEISSKNQSYLKVADKTGLGSYSFDELFYHIKNDAVLMSGEPSVLASTEGLKHLVDALANLPELSLALERGKGPINTMLVAQIIHGWINGAPISDLSSSFVGKTEEDRIRAAGTYVFSKVSQTVSWGAHAYLKGRAVARGDEDESVGAEIMLPAYIQYGVKKPEAVMASMLGVPRALAMGVADTYEAEFGKLRVDESMKFKKFLEGSDQSFWNRSVSKTSLLGKVSGEDVRIVWREAQGIL